MHQVLCHDEFEYEYEHKNPITIPTGKVRMHQVLCHDEFEYESPITPTGKKRMHQVLCHDEYEYERKEKYITKVLRVALKKEKIYYRSVCFQTLFISL